MSGTFPLTVAFSNTSSGSITSLRLGFRRRHHQHRRQPHSKVYAAAGVYTVKLTVTGPGGSNTQTRSNYITVSAAAPLAGSSPAVRCRARSPLTRGVQATPRRASITSYAWDFGDGTTSTVASPSKVYAAAGVYTVKLTVTGPGGSNTQTRSNYITVSATAPLAQFTGSPVLGTFPLTVAFSNTSSGSITKRRLGFRRRHHQHRRQPQQGVRRRGCLHCQTHRHRPGRQQHPDAQQLHHRFRHSTAGAGFTGSPVSGTFPLTVAFKQHLVGQHHELRRSFGDGTTSTVASPSKVYAAAGVYTVKLTVTGPGGSNTQTRSNYITVSAAAPLAQFTGSPVSGTVPADGGVQATPRRASITSYAWDFGDGTTSTVASPSKVYAAAGVYTVKLTVTGPGGSNTQTRSNYITVSATAPLAQFTGSPGVGHVPADGGVQQHLVGQHHELRLGFRRRHHQHRRQPHSKVYAAAGVYTVKLTVTGPGGSNTQTRSNYITVSAAAPLASSSPAVRCRARSR